MAKCRATNIAKNMLFCFTRSGHDIVLVMFCISDGKATAICLLPILSDWKKENVDKPIFWQLRLTVNSELGKTEPGGQTQVWIYASN